MDTKLVLGMALVVTTGGWCAATWLFLPGTRRLIRKNCLLREKSHLISVIAVLVALAVNSYFGIPFLVFEQISNYLIVTLAGTLALAPVFIFLGHAFFLLAVRQLSETKSTTTPNSEGE